MKNPSAFWLPDVKIVEEHGGTEYTVTGSYEGTETLDRKLRRIMEQIVWKHIQEVISVVTRYEAYFRSEMEQKLRIQSEESLRQASGKNESPPPLYVIILTNFSLAV